MNAETLRRAASLMRERANSASTSPWVTNGTRVDSHMIKAVADCYDEPIASRADAEHIASWQPTVALAVAAMLETEAEMATASGPGWATDEAIAVARAYLGDAS